MTNRYKNPNYQADWRERNKEKLKVDRKKYYEKNKEVLLGKYKEKYHTPDIKANKKTYYENNKIKILARAKEKYQEKKEDKEFISLISSDSPSLTQPQEQ